jgi:ubiquinol-cytochrome c reductase cytochrome b/c1 subunit
MSLLIVIQLGLGNNYVPSSKFGKWFNDRLPLLSLGAHLTDYPTPKNLNYWWTFGGILTFCLITQIITGIVLGMHYIAHADLAFESVEHIMRDVNYGWLIRYVHANGASMFFLAVYIHIFRSLYYGSYKSPREVIWIIGMIIYLLMMMTAFMGYVLPWGQMSFWGATVITSLFSAVPLVGESITNWLWGGYSVDNPTLTRFFSLHYLLPFLILGLVILHIWALHVPGNNNPIGIDVKKPSKDTVPFHPYIVIKDLFALLLFLIVFAFFVFYSPNILGHSDNYIEANPMVTPAHIVPEWYLLPFYAILRSVPDKLLGVVAMFASIFILMALPWLDTSKIRSAVFRPLYKQFYWLLVIDVLVLGYVGAMPAEGIYLLVARIATAYYFIHFLVILPFLGMKEKTIPLPLSISDPVLGGVSPKMEMAKATKKLEDSSFEKIS